MTVPRGLDARSFAERFTAGTLPMPLNYAAQLLLALTL